MKTFIELSREGKLVHSKMDALLALMNEIISEDYTTRSQVLGAISNNLDSLFIESVAINKQMEVIVND